MRISDKAIVLQSIKYGDKKLILKLFSKQHGLLTVSAVVSNSPSSKIKPGTILPLHLIDVELIKKDNQDVQRLTEASCYYITDQISSSITKLSIAQFINEILIKSLKEQSANEHLFDFIEGCLKELNESESGFINLHVYFLFELSKYLGIEPNNNFSAETPYFDCREGQFTAMSLAFPLGLTREDSLLFSEALKVNMLLENISNAQRHKLLETLIAYYQMHIPGFNQMKSMEVLKEVVLG